MEAFSYRILRETSNGDRDTFISLATYPPPLDEKHTCFQNMELLDYLQHGSL